MGSKYKQLLKLEEQVIQQKIELTPDQVQAIKKANPCYKECHVESTHLCELLCQDTFYVGQLIGTGKAYLQTVIDTYTSHGFGYLHTGKLPEHSVSVLYNDVIPKYQACKLPVKSLLTDNGREFCGNPSHPYEMFLELSDIEHIKTKVRHTQTNGFVVQFNRTVFDEFFRPAFRAKMYESVAALQKVLNKWLKDYNEMQPYLGYRNIGKRLVDRIKEYLKCVLIEG